MPLPGHAALRRIAGGVRRPADAPATTALRSAVAQAAAIARGGGVAYTAVQIAIWHSFYEAVPWRLAAPAAAIVWGTLMCAYLRRRWPRRGLAVADTLVYAVIALGAGWCTPPAVRGTPTTWLFIVIIGQMFVPAWFTPVKVFIPLVAALGAAFRAGSAVTSSAGYAGHHPALAGIFLGVVAAMHWCARAMLYRRAAVLDTGLANAGDEARGRYVQLSRNLERREHERILHDTVLNTLTALARGGAGDAAVGRCRHDVALMEYVLGVPGEAEGTARRHYGGLLAGIEAVAAEMRTRGLIVHISVGGADPGPGGAAPDPGTDAGTPAADATTGAGEPAAAGHWPAVPVPVAVALTYALREALANVASHAGTGEAWVEVQPSAPDSEPGAPDAVEMIVRDKGAGFDPERVDPARLGLRRSIVERLGDCGAQASIVSAPGEGTLVTLRWCAAPHPRPAPAASQAGMPW